MQRRGGMTMLELLLVFAVIAIVTAIATPNYLAWRADATNREVVALIERTLSDARQDSKRTSSDVIVAFTDGANRFVVGGRSISLPNGSRIETEDGDPVSVTFRGLMGVQEPFEPVRIDVVTGGGLLERTAAVTIIPPLAKTAMTR